jgi:glycosyltransferase involved in cell wall biosynthesis
MMKSDKNKNPGIIIINSARKWIGEAAHCITLTKGLLDRGYNVVLVCRKGFVLEEKAREQNIPYYALDMRGNFTGILDLIDLLSLRKIIKKHNIRLIHCHRGKDHWLSACVRYLFTQKNRPALVRTRHVTVPVKTHFLNMLLYKYWTDGVIAVSEKASESFYGLPLKSCPKVIYASVDSEKFNPDKRSKALRREWGVKDSSENEVVIGLIGRLQRIKGQSVFITAAGKILRYIPDARFIIAGKGSERKRKPLLKLAKECGIAENLTILGYVDNIENVAASFDVGVIASLGSEGSSRIAMEYMASGVPVVATNVGGLPEILENGKYGELVPPGDSDKLAMAIIGTLLNCDKSKKVADLSIEKARSYYSIERFCEDTVSEYRKLL